MNKHILAAALLTALTAQAAHAEGDKADASTGEREKCYGVAKAGKNECMAKDGSNGCAGQSKKDNDPQNWINVPKGLCEKLAGGSL